MRQSELESFAEHIRWLDEVRALASFEYASQFLSDQVPFGLNPRTVRGIESHTVDSMSVAVHWVGDRIPSTGSVRVVFSQKIVFVAETRFFVDRWPDLFCPGRDDVLILANDDDWVLSYGHCLELEYGHRIRTAV